MPRGRRRSAAVGALPTLVWHLIKMHVTLRNQPAGDAPGCLRHAPGDGPSTLPDRFEHDTIDILKRVSRRPIDPSLQSELLADLGFDSLQVLELVGELEDHFGVAVPLNDLTHIRTVAQVVDEIRTLAASGERAS
jgi:acyl carrier protein